MVNSPFSFENLAAGSSIIGRETQVSQAVSVLKKTNKSIVIYENPRSGKETVVREVLARLTSDNKRILLCEMDLFNIRTFAEFISLFRMKLYECSKVAFKDSLLPFSVNLESVPNAKLFEIPQLFAQEADMQMIVYIKEFQVTATFDEEDKVSLEFLDKLWSKQTNVKYILTGSSVNIMRDIFEQRKLFYSFTTRIELPELEKSEVCRFISSSFINLGRVIEAEEAMAIYDVGGGNMWYIKQICMICCSMPAGYLNRRLVNQAKEALLSLHSARFTQIMFDLTQNQINLLRAIIDGVVKFSSAEILEKYKLNSSANVFRIKEALAKKEVITFDKEESVRIIDRLFEYWLRTCYFSR